MTTLRLLLGVVASKDLELEQLDVMTTFLHGDLEEDIYMSQLAGFSATREKSHLVCRLKKSLYGLKPVPRVRCREDFRPQAETRGRRANRRGAADAHKRGIGRLTWEEAPRCKVLPPWSIKGREGHM